MDEKRNRRRQTPEGSCKKKLRKRFPILSWLPQYKRSDFTADVIAGITVGLTVVPQSMAYAAIAGLTPEFGLYSAYFGVILYVFLGSTRQVTIGPTAVMGLLTYETCGNNFSSCAILTGFYSGVFELLMAILQLGWIVNFISESVVIGFTSGAATTIISSQMKSFLGLSGPKGSGFIGYWKAIYQDIHTINFADCSLGIISFISLLLLRKLKDYKHPATPHKKVIEKVLWLLSVSRNVIIVLITSFIAFLWGNPPFKLTGHVHAGFPDVSVPSFNLPTNSTNDDGSHDDMELMTFWQTWSYIGAGPLIVALIAVLQNVAISKAFGSGQTIDATQEMFALGCANIIGSFFSSIPVSGSFSRSAVNESSGVASPMGGLFTGILVLLSLGFLTKSFYYIPKASLAAVIICAVMFMIEYESLPVMWNVNLSCSRYLTVGPDVMICLITYCCAITLGLEYGILIGVTISIVVILIKMLKPDVNVSVVFDEYAKRKYIHVKPSSGIQFPSIDYIRTQLTKIANRNKEINLIVLNLEKWETFDYTTILTVKSLCSSFKKEGKRLIITSQSTEFKNALTAAGLTNEEVFSENIKDYLKKSEIGDTTSPSLPCAAIDINEETSQQYDGIPANTNAIKMTTATADVVKPLLR